MHIILRFTSNKNDNSNITLEPCISAMESCIAYSQTFVATFAIYDNCNDKDKSNAYYSQFYSCNERLDRFYTICATAIVLTLTFTFTRM